VNGLDPIFLAQEPEEKVSRSTALLWQYFFFPVLMVAAAVGVFVLFGAWSDSAPDEKELLQTVLSGSENAQKQAAQQLASAIAQARAKADKQAAAGEKVDAPFFVDPQFAEGLRKAFAEARREGKSEERQRWLAQALGRTADPANVAPLVDVLYPDPGAPAAPTEIRRAAALGLLFQESRAAEGALVRALGDPEDGEVRAIAANALALLAVKDQGRGEAPATRQALVKALGDAHTGVQLNAAVGLAMRGDPAGLDLLTRALTRTGLQTLDVRDLDLQRNALINATRALWRLSSMTTLEPEQAARVAALEPAVKALADDDPDESVRTIARKALERWRKT
jgi:HEAT repeat protein